MLAPGHHCTSSGTGQGFRFLSVISHLPPDKNATEILGWPQSLLGVFCSILRKKKRINFLANPILSSWKLRLCPAQSLAGGKCSVNSGCVIVIGIFKGSPRGARSPPRQRINEDAAEEIQEGLESSPGDSLGGRSPWKWPSSDQSS